MKQIIPVFAIFLLVFSLVACGNDHDHDHHHNDHGHQHGAPHGGTLVEIGDHFSHLEFLLDQETGELVMYSLDDEAVRAVRLETETVDLIIRELPGHETEFTITLHAVENPLTGETAGDSSEFHGQHDLLIGAEQFSVEIPEIEIKGVALENIQFPFPEGNE